MRTLRRHSYYLRLAWWHLVETWYGQALTELVLLVWVFVLILAVLYAIGSHP